MVGGGNGRRAPAKEKERGQRRERDGAWKGALRAIEGEGESVGVRREGETEKGVGDGDVEGAKGTEGRETDGVGGWWMRSRRARKGSSRVPRAHDCIYAQTFLRHNSPRGGPGEAQGRTGRDCRLE